MPIQFNLRKFLLSCSYLAAGWYTLTLIFSVFHNSAPEFYRNAVAAGGFWLVLTAVTWGNLILSYADRMTRFRIAIPASIGALLAAAAFFGTIFGAEYPGYTLVLAVSFVEIALWSVLVVLEERTRRRFVQKGYGLMPVDAWINPPASALQEGDIILTSGRIARRTKNTVGHMELVLKRVDDKGQHVAFSSYMENGLVLHTLRALCRSEAKNSFYIAMRPRTPFTAEQNQQAMALVDEMLVANMSWTEAETLRRTALVERLLPSWMDRLTVVGRFVPAMRQGLLARYLPTGYDWMGLYTGRSFANRWTCMGACLEVLRKVGVPTRAYGTGLLGLGTGLFNPLMPVRFLAEPSYRLLTKADEQALRN